MQESDSSDYPCRLYLISPPSISLPEFSAQLQSALSAGDVGAFQLRLKDMDAATVKEAALALQVIAREHDVAFIINDDVHLAREIDADGVHLGQDDMPLAEARALLGDDSVIGISCHDSSHMAMEAGDNGADYVAFGAFYHTNSKSAEKLAKYGTPTPDVVAWWSTYTIVPCVAIGGMSPQNCAPLVEAGADFIAAIQSVWNHPKGAGAAVVEFNDAIKKALHTRKEALRKAG